MLLLAILGPLLLIAAVGLVILLSGANDFPGKPVDPGPAGSGNRQTAK